MILHICLVRRVKHPKVPYQNLIVRLIMKIFLSTLNSKSVYKYWQDDGLGYGKNFKLRSSFHLDLQTHFSIDKVYYKNVL